VSRWRMAVAPEVAEPAVAGNSQVAAELARIELPMPHLHISSRQQRVGRQCEAFLLSLVLSRAGPVSAADIVQEP
jgi:hypothetical protein